MSGPWKPNNPTAPRWSITNMSSKSIASSKPASILKSKWAGFLTEVAGFANTPALLGNVELIEGEKRHAIAIVHAFVQNQGDAWTVTSAYLERFVDEQRLLRASEQADVSEEQVPYLRYMSQTGRRVAEMHAALASSETGDFAPEPTQAADVQRWTEGCIGSRRTRVRAI